MVAALCWCGGMLISAIGVYLHQLWLMWLGSGVIGGIGLGLGYISPVSTLIKWFPDRRGMATGMAIMGFGGGAMIGAPLADMLMNYFRTPTDVGVWQTFVTLAAIYFVFMLGGAFGYRVPPANWRPDGWTPPPETRSMITQHQVHLRDAHKTRAFWMIWLVLCLNVSAGIGVIGMASPMLQEIFGGSLLGLPDVGFAQLDPDQKKAIAAIAAGFTGLLSLFNIGGRFFWASISDHLGRKRTYYLFFLLGIALYALAPTAAHIGSKALFVLMFGVILSMYGGGFATVPAYLADIFGTQFVGAIHGRLLTAWSTAGIIGPVIVNYIREYEKSIGVPSDKLYDVTMYVLAGLLVLGLIANSLVRPLAERWYMRPDEVLALQPRATVAVTARRLVRDRPRRVRRQGAGCLAARRRADLVGRVGHPLEGQRAVPVNRRRRIRQCAAAGVASLASGTITAPRPRPINPAPAADTSQAAAGPTAPSAWPIGSANRSMPWAIAAQPYCSNPCRTIPPPTQSMAAVPTSPSSLRKCGITRTMPRPMARATGRPLLASAKPTSSAFTMTATVP